MSIYTKTGDRGETGIWGGKRIQKDHKIIEALGAIDELNALLGTIDLPPLENVQKDLMIINSVIAGFKAEIPDPEKLEKEIDKMEEKLPPLTNFILPKGTLHLARAVCRRAERRAVAAGFKIKYLNRLSDYLFVLARWANFKSGEKETIWRVG